MQICKAYESVQEVSVIDINVIEEWWSIVDDIDFWDYYLE